MSAEGGRRLATWFGLTAATLAAVLLLNEAAGAEEVPFEHLSFEGQVDSLEHVLTEDRKLLAGLEAANVEGSKDLYIRWRELFDHTLQVPPTVLDPKIPLNDFQADVEALHADIAKAAKEASIPTDYALAQPSGNVTEDSLFRRPYGGY